MRLAQNSDDPCTPRPGPSAGAPPLFSPTCSGSAFPAAASAAIVSEHPCVTLFEWWLARVEGHDKKIAVGGRFLRNQEVLNFPAVPIAKCHEPYVLESENGTVVTIYGSFNINRTLENGFTIEACEKFSTGFPQWWEKWMLYPKMMRSQTGSQSTSSSTSSSSKFYLEMLQKGKLLDSLGTQIWNALNKVEAFPDSSCLPNGAPRFEEYISDDDTPTIKNSAASNYDDSEVMDMKIVLAGASAFNEEKGHEGIYSNVPSASMVECTIGEGNVGVGNASSINNGFQKTPVSSLKRQYCLKKPQCMALSESVPAETTTLPSSEKGEQPVGPSRKQRSAFGKLQGATRSSSIICASPNPVGPSRKQRSAFGKLQRVTRSSSIICPSPNGDLSQLSRFWPKSSSLATPESLKLKKTRSGRVVVPLLDRACQNIVYSPDGSVSAIIGLDSTPPLKGSMLKNHAKKKKRTN